VTYRPVAGQGFEANNGMVAVALQRRGKHVSTIIELLPGKHVPAATVTHATGETGCFLHGRHLGVIKRREFG
jgi:hypothetical protein